VPPAGGRRPGAAVKELAALKLLRTLKIDLREDPEAHCWITDLAALTQLQTLRFGGGKITDAGVK
jgi:hypothetical protein